MPHTVGGRGVGGWGALKHVTQLKVRMLIIKVRVVIIKVRVLIIN